MTSSCILAYICYAQHLEAKTMLNVLFMVAVVFSTLIMRLWTQDGQNAEAMGAECTAEITPSKEIKIDMPNPVSPLDHPQDTAPRELATNNSLDGLSQSLTDEQVEPNDNITAREHTKVDIPERVSLLHQTPTVSEESPTNSLLTGLSRDLMEEGHDTSSRVRIGVSEGVAQPTPQRPPQPSLQPPSLAVEAAASTASETEFQVPELKTEFKVSCWVITISTGGIISVLAGLPGNEKAVLTHNILFKAYTWLAYVSLILGVGLFLLTVKRRNISGLGAIVKFTMWIALASVTYALGFATCILLPKSLVVLVVVLVVPLVLVSLVVILHSMNHCN